MRPDSLACGTLTPIGRHPLSERICTDHNVRVLFGQEENDRRDRKMSKPAACGPVYSTARVRRQQGCRTSHRFEDWNEKLPATNVLQTLASPAESRQSDQLRLTASIHEEAIR